MQKSQQTQRNPPAPSFLAHLEEAYGWGQARALDALGTYLMSTAAGARLQDQLASRDHAPRAA